MIHLSRQHLSLGITDYYTFIVSNVPLQIRDNHSDKVLILRDPIQDIFWSIPLPDLPCTITLYGMLCYQHRLRNRYLSFQIIDTGEYVFLSLYLQWWALDAIDEASYSGAHQGWTQHTWVLNQIPHQSEPKEFMFNDLFSLVKETLVLQLITLNISHCILSEVLDEDQELGIIIL